MKLLILHTSEHHDPALIASIWRSIFNSCQSYDMDPLTSLKIFLLSLRPGRKESIFASRGSRVGAWPTILSFRKRIPRRCVPMKFSLTSSETYKDMLAEMLETFSLTFRADAPPGWALRVLVEGNIPQEIVLEYFEQIRSSGVSLLGGVHSVINNLEGRAIPRRRGHSTCSG
jgi:hypothetical protein